MKKEIHNWKRISTKEIAQTRIFSLQSHQVSSPSGHYIDDFYTLECGDWVNVIPITDKNEVILVKQFRHGIQEVALEIPGGVIDLGEEPIKAAKRELEEETGYISNDISSLGFAHPNPAIQPNKIHSFLAKNCKPLSKQNLDPAEDIAVELIPIKELGRLILEQKINHSLVLSAILRYFISENKF